MDEDNGAVVDGKIQKSEGKNATLLQYIIYTQFRWKIRCTLHIIFAVQVASNKKHRHINEKHSQEKNAYIYESQSGRIFTLWFLDFSIYHSTVVLVHFLLHVPIPFFPSIWIYMYIYTSVGKTIEKREWYPLWKKTIERTYTYEKEYEKPAKTFR